MKVSLNVHLTLTKTFFPVSMKKDSAVQEMWRIPLCLECLSLPAIGVSNLSNLQGPLKFYLFFQPLSQASSMFYNPGLYATAYHSVFY